MYSKCSLIIIWYGGPNSAHVQGDCSSQKHCIQNCDQTAANACKYWHPIETIYSLPYPTVTSPTPCDLPFSHNTCATDRQTTHRTQGLTWRSAKKNSKIPISTVEASKVVPEVSESVSKTSFGRLSGAVAWVYHRTRLSWSIHQTHRTVSSLRQYGRALLLTDTS